MSPFKYILFCASVVAAVSITPATTQADTSNIADELVVTREVKVDLGYQAFSLDDNANRAGEYRSFTSSPTLGLRAFNDSEGDHLDIDATLLSDEDFNATISYNRGSLFRLDLRTERFFHNLDHIPYDNGFTGGEAGPPLIRTLTGTPAEGSRPDGAYTDDSNVTRTRTFYTDQNPDDRYGLRLDVNEAKFKIKHPTYPAHLSLTYWRYEKEGEKQMRFVGENCTTACHMQSKTRKVNRLTEEIKVGADAHVGFIDLAVETLHRTFRDKQPIERDTFGTHFRGRDLTDNPLEHSEDPDSRLTEVTFKGNTAPSGGLVGSASFTIGERKNQSKLTSIGPVTAKTDYYKSAADVTYTPGAKWTFNMRYRLLDMESDNTDQFVDYDSTKVNPLDVRDPVDITRAWYEMIVNYRPSNRLTIKGELRREDISRSNTGPEVSHSSGPDPIVINPNWQLPDDEIITRAKIGFHSRLLEKSALKVSSWIALQHSDDPAYGTSYEDSRQLFFSTSYNPSPYWGMLANVNLLEQDNDRHELHGYDLEREKQQQNANISTYFVPRDGLSFNINYGYFRTKIEQDLLFGAGPGFVPFPPFSFDYGIPDYDVDFDQTVHSINAGVTWQVREDLLCNLEAYHIRSKSSFSPDFGTVGPNPYDIFGSGGTASASSAGLTDISRVDMRQNGIKGRVSWQIDDNWSCSIQATYDEYNDVNSNIFDGTVVSTMASLSRTW